MVKEFTALPGTDGTFQIGGLRDGDYTVRVTGRPTGFYVKSVRHLREDALKKPLHYAGASDNGILEVVLRPGAVKVTGTVVDSKSQPAPGIQVILIPETALRNRFEFNKSVATDQAGHFTMRDVAPGQYKMFSWEGG